MNTPSTGRTRSLSATRMIGDPVVNPRGENLGRIEDFAIDPLSAHVDFAVMSLTGLAGTGDKLFPVPLEALKLSREDKKFILDVERERLRLAPGFEKGNWPDTSDRAFGTKVYTYYGYTPRSGS